MAAKPLTTEAIALTEKKMDMTLDDIIKMSKKPTTKDTKAPRRPIKSQGFLNGIASQRSNRVQRFMDSRASIRQGVLAQRRIAPATARRQAADSGVVGKEMTVVPPKQRPQTMDALFANMKENRMRVMSSQQQASRDNRQIARRRRARQQQQQQVRGVRGVVLPGHWLGNSGK